MAEHVSQPSSLVYRAACELAAYRLRDALEDKPFIEYDDSLESVMLRCLPQEVASITVASAVDGSQATLYKKTFVWDLDKALPGVRTASRSYQDHNSKKSKDNKIN